MKWIVAILCFFVGGFCVFGFLASFELDLAEALPFRVGYAVILLACLAGIVAAFVPRGDE